jgi:hypothetical protein
MRATTMDDDMFQRLIDINDELVNLCGWVYQRLDTATAEKLVPVVSKLTRLVAEISVGRG